MTNHVHSSLSGGRWFTFTLAEQLANVGSEFERALSWKKRGDQVHFEKAFDRMLELLDLTIADPRWLRMRRLKELLRVREVLCDFFYGDNAYQTTPDYLSRYFLYFGIAARASR
jgi:hypothetical protein